MISVIYDRQDFTLTVRGHANTAEYGHDLVCAAASVLLHTYSAAADLLYNRGYVKRINRDHIERMLDDRSRGSSRLRRSCPTRA